MWLSSKELPLSVEFHKLSQDLWDPLQCPRLLTAVLLHLHRSLGVLSGGAFLDACLVYTGSGLPSIVAKMTNLVDHLEVMVKKGVLSGTSSN